MIILYATKLTYNIFDFASSEKKKVNQWRQEIRIQIFAQLKTVETIYTLNYIYNPKNIIGKY